MRNVKILPSFLGLLLFLSACNLAIDMSEDGITAEPDPDLQTQVAFAVQQTQAALPGASTATFTPEESASSGIPTVTVSVQTNCRTGPGEPYEVLGFLNVGQIAEVVGRNASGETWIIKLPSNPAVTCWLWGFYATVVGETASLTVYTPPPTPTPAAGVSIAFTHAFECEDAYYFRFQLDNTGSETWESFYIVITDTTTSVTTEDWDNVFRNFTTCAATTDNSDNLEPGDRVFAGNFNTGGFNYNPTGHNLTATITLFSEEGSTGRSMTKSISFSP